MKLEQVVATLLDKVERCYYGKYRGFVVDNRDPLKLGRLKLTVPSIMGDEITTGWATPCAAFGGVSNQGFLFIPDVGAGVWVEFEEGNIEFPIWVGVFWSKSDSGSELPLPNRSSDGSEESALQDKQTTKILKTAKGHTVQFEDADGAEMLLIREGSKGHFMAMDTKGIKIAALGHSIEFTDSGITIMSANGNALTLSTAGLILTAKATPLQINAAGQAITITGGAINLAKG